MRQLAIVLGLILAGGSVFVISGRCPERTDELPDDEYAAFVMAHGDKVYFLGLNMYPFGPIRWKSRGWVCSDGPQGGRTYRTHSRDVKLAHPIGGHWTAQITSGRNDVSSVGYLNVEETVERKFSLGAERHRIEKTAG